jgi:hypothetical protein
MKFVYWHVSSLGLHVVEASTHITCYHAYYELERPSMSVASVRERSAVLRDSST